MRYQIPKDKKTRESEQVQILRSTVNPAEAQNVEDILKFIFRYADTPPNPVSQGYTDLFKAYQALKMTRETGEWEEFPEKERSPQNFYNKLEELWQILELHTIKKDRSYAGTLSYLRNNPQEKTLLQDMEKEEEKNPQTIKTVEEKDLIDKDSPYFGYVAGTAYADLFNKWSEFKKTLDVEASRSHLLLQEDMTKLLAAIQVHYIKRNNMDSFFPMTAEEYREIHKLYQDCLADIGRVSGDKDPLVYAGLRKMLARDELQLNGLSPDHLPPLADILSIETTPTIRLENKEKQIFGGAMSLREAVELTDKDGRLIRGFVTEDVVAGDENQDLDTIFERYQKDFPQYKNDFSRLNNREAYIELSQAVFDVRDGNANAVEECYEKQKEKYGLPGDPQFHEKYVKLAQDLKNLRLRYAIWNSSGIGTGDHIAERASAMCDVAKSLGFPELLVSSRRVTVERDGKQIPAVFMENAADDSVDLVYARADSPIMNTDSREFENREMLRSLANLQIIDYLCANTDRHSYNFFVRQDSSDSQHPKLLGVQGIDNDNSFGDVMEGGQMELASWDNLKIITPEMADAVTGMTRKRFHDILAEYHLTNAQMKAADTRLRALQAMIDAGRKEPYLEIKTNGKIKIDRNKPIHIVKDDEWEKLTLDCLIPEKAPTTDKFGNKTGEHQPVNIFSTADELRNKRSKLKQNPIKKPPIVYTRHEGKVSYNRVENRITSEVQKLRDIQTWFTEHGGDEPKRSREFKTMQTALRELISRYESLQEIFASANLSEQDKEKQIGEEYRQLNQKRAELKAGIERYLHKKHHKKITRRNQDRIDGANKLADLVKESPASEKLFESETESHNRQYSKNEHQQNVYFVNSVYNLMHETLRGNVYALERGDERKGKGILALKAQERLWNYAMTDTGKTKNTQAEKKEDLEPKKEEDKNRVRTSVYDLEEELKKEREEAPNLEQIQKDMEIVRAYAPELKDPTGKTVYVKKEEITPQKMKNLLQSLLLQEAKVAEERERGEKAKEVQIKQKE